MHNHSKPSLAFHWISTSIKLRHCRPDPDELQSDSLTPINQIMQRHAHTSAETMLHTLQRIRSCCTLLDTRLTYVPGESVMGKRYVNSVPGMMGHCCTNATPSCSSTPRLLATCYNLERKAWCLLFSSSALSAAQRATGDAP